MKKEIRNMKIDEEIINIQEKFKTGDVMAETLKKSAPQSFEHLMVVNPEFVKAAYAYIKYAENLVRNGYIPKQVGVVEPSSEERKAVLKAFTMDSAQKIRAIQPIDGVLGAETFLYQIMESVFEASLLVEQGAQRKYQESKILCEQTIELEQKPSFYVCWYGPTVLLLNTQKGHIYKPRKGVLSKRDEAPCIRSVEKEHGLYQAVLESGTVIPLCTDERLRYDIWSWNRVLKDSTKFYYQVHLDVSPGKPMVQMPAHVLLALVKYGPDFGKHLLLKDSLITCDHVDMRGNHNAISNVEFVSRRDNTLRARCKNPDVLAFVCGYDLADFWKTVQESLNQDQLRYNQMQNLRYWEGVLSKHSVDEIIK